MSDATECFVTGTAAGVTPITGLAYNDKKAIFNKSEVGPLTANLRDTLKGIQYGTLPDTKGWMVKI
jgi:branched-chain amino acid aminotransferase